MHREYLDEESTAQLKLPEMQAELDVQIRWEKYRASCDEHTRLIIKLLFPDNKHGVKGNSSTIDMESLNGIQNSLGF